MRTAGWIVTLGTAGALAAGALAYSRGKLRLIAVRPPKTPPERFSGLAVGGYYRVWCTAPEDSADEKAVEDRLRIYGFDPLVTSKDPTDARVWTSVAVWRGPEDGSENVPPVFVYQTDPVDAPPPPAEPGPPTLDPGASSTDARAIDIALRTERDPSELRGFADACRIDMPVSEALLRARANEVERGIESSPVTDAVRVPPRGISGALAYTRRLASGLFGSEEGGASFGAASSAFDKSRILEDDSLKYVAQQEAIARDARLLREISQKVSYSSERAKIQYEETHDEYGTPCVRVPSPVVQDGEVLVAYPHPMGGYCQYQPMYPPIDAFVWMRWPQSLRTACPHEWSGDFTRRMKWWAGWKSGDPSASAIVTYDPFTRGEAMWGSYASPFDFTNPVPSSDAVAVLQDASLLRRCGWGRFNGLPSSITGEPGKCEVRWSVDMSHAFDAAGGAFEILWKMTSEIGKAIARAIKAIAPILSLIPGLGTALSMALTCAAGIALGEDLDQIFASTLAAALPGGAIVKTAFESGVAIVGGLIEGKPFDEALLDGARTAAISAASYAGAADAAAAAFDAAVAVFQGKSLQEAGFRAFVGLVPGGSLLEKGKQFAESVSRALEKGLDVGELLVRELEDELAPLGRAVRSTGIGKAVDAVLSSVRTDLIGQTLLDVSSDEMARKLGLPEPVARAAQAAVKLLDDGTPVVDEALLGRLRPAPPVTREGAIKLASYEDQRLTAKGRVSGAALYVAAPERLPLTLAQIDRGVRNGDPSAALLREEIDRAARMVARQTYVERYLSQELAA